MSRLTRKQVKVRGKNGKVYQRSMMVQAQAIGRRAGKSGKLHALNPWEPHHTAHVKTGGPDQPMSKFSGSSGPGSTHSWYAHVVGANKQRQQAFREAGTSEHDLFTRHHAEVRRAAGAAAAQEAHSWGRSSASEVLGYALSPVPRTAGHAFNLGETFGHENVSHVPPRRH